MFSCPNQNVEGMLPLLALPYLLPPPAPSPGSVSLTLKYLFNYPHCYCPHLHLSPCFSFNWSPFLLQPYPFLLQVLARLILQILNLISSLLCLMTINDSECPQEEVQSCCLHPQAFHGMASASFPVSSHFTAHIPVCMILFCFFSAPSYFSCPSFHTCHVLGLIPNSKFFFPTLLSLYA